MKKTVQILMILFGLMWLGGCSSTSTASYTVGGNAKGAVKGVVLLNRTLYKKNKTSIGSGDGNYDRGDCEPEPFRPDSKVQKSLSKTWSEGNVEYTSAQEKLTLKKEGSFAFAKKYESGTEYNVTILSQPDMLECTLDNPTGVITGIGVTDMVLTCVDKEAPLNQPPVANAGDDQNVTEESSVILDGSGSKDPDGSIVSYRWAEGNTVLSTAKSFAKTDFAAGTHTVTLTVTDDDGATGSDEVKVTVNPIAPPPETNNPPEAVITYPKENQTYNCFYEESPIVLDGNASSDPDGDLLSFRWSGTSGTHSIDSAIDDKNAPVTSIPLDGDDGLCRLVDEKCDDSNGNCKVLIKLNVSDGQVDDNASVTIFLRFPT
jgi:hypothetical protein